MKTLVSFLGTLAAAPAFAHEGGAAHLHPHGADAILLTAVAIVVAWLILALAR